MLILGIPTNSTEPSEILKTSVFIILCKYLSFMKNNFVTTYPTGLTGDL